MANYFVINNKFKPYSFDELIKPYQMYGQAYKEQEAIIDAAREKEFSPDYLDQSQDTTAYNMYNQASNNLKVVSDELATKGLSAGLRGKIRTVARDYQTTMNALNDAQQRLYAEQDRRAKLGPDYVYQQNNLRIGDFLNGATPNQRSASLSDITKDIAAEFATRAKSITRDTWQRAMDQNGKVISGYYDVTTEQGLTGAQLDTILSDEDTWRRIMSDQSINKEDKDNLQRFRDVIASKKRAIGYDEFGVDNQFRIDDAIIRGASAGLGSVTHKYQQDHSYNPLGWATYNLNEDKWRAEKLEAEAPYTHSDEDNPTPQNRTGLKPGYSIKNGKLQYSTGNDSNSSGSGTTYTTTTPGITIHTNKYGTKTYSSWEKAGEGNQKSKIEDMPTVAIEDITDPDIQRALLNRINVPNANVRDAELPILINNNLQRLNQLTVQISGEKDTNSYAWAISDKKIQKLTGEESESTSEDDKTL